MRFYSIVFVLLVVLFGYTFFTVQPIPDRVNIYIAERNEFYAKYQIPSNITPKELTDILMQNPKARDDFEQVLVGGNNRVYEFCQQYWTSLSSEKPLNAIIIKFGVAIFSFKNPNKFRQNEEFLPGIVIYLAVFIAVYFNIYRIYRRKRRA